MAAHLQHNAAAFQPWLLQSAWLTGPTYWRFDAEMNFQYNDNVTLVENGQQGTSRGDPGGRLPQGT